MTHYSSLLLASLLPVAAAAQVVAPARGAADLAGLSRDLQALSERVKPAVVQILITGYAPADGQLVKQRASGSGVILDSDGYVITNAHVVQGARRVQVALAGLASGPPGARSILKAPGRIVGAVVVGTDLETDLAVLKVDEKGLPVLTFGDSEALRPGELVLAFGSPLGLENSVTFGVVSAVARQVRPEDRMIYVQTDASINPGNSGGPLVDGQGRVVGINTFIYSQSGGSEGIGFAAPSNIVRNVFDQIRRTGRVHRGEIGVRVQTVTPALAAGLGLRQDWGVVLSDVPPDGAAARAGLRIGDLVVKLDGKVMENARQLEVDLYPRVPGGSVTLEVLRGAERLTYVVTVAERLGDPERFADRVSPERNSVARLGVLALDLDETVAQMLPPLRARAGVVVATADGRTGPDPLMPGDVIYSLNQEPVTGVESLRQALDRVRSGGPVVLKVERGGELRFLILEPE
ncbi:MAG TPA: trypsin-like peptidase domain-containing protein [Vicinamibacteria bacterium]|jgi:serine protease Do|nr:trypsin-like peptidase domain-containing protein [Vicinamibacteria bacterium]